MSNLTTSEEMVILEKYKLTPDELFSIQLILFAAEEGSTEFLFRFCSISDDHKLVFRNALISLQEKGVILKSYTIPKPGESFIPEEVAFNKSFIKNLFRASFDMGKELFEEYPTFGFINGQPVQLKGVAKKFNSLEDMYRFYGKQIGWKPEKHEEVMELVRWAKENNIIKESIASFVVNNSWISLKEMRDGDAVNINFDAVRMI